MNVWCVQLLVVVAFRFCHTKHSSIRCNTKMMFSFYKNKTKTCTSLSVHLCIHVSDCLVDAPVIVLPFLLISVQLCFNLDSLYVEFVNMINSNMFVFSVSLLCWDNRRTLGMFVCVW